MSDEKPAQLQIRRATPTMTMIIERCGRQNLNVASYTSRWCVQVQVNLAQSHNTVTCDDRTDSDDYDNDHDGIRLGVSNLKAIHRLFIDVHP